MTVPYTFATATSAIPLSQLDSNFATAITLGSTALYLGNTNTTIAGLTLTSPTLTTPALGTPASGVLTNCTGLPAGSITGTLGVANGGTGVTTSTGSGNTVLSTSPTLVTPILGTPTSVTLTNATGLPLSTGVTGTLATTNGGTGLTSFTANGVVYASSTSALTTGSALTFDGTTQAVTGKFSSSNAGNENYLLSDGSTRTSLQHTGNSLYFNVNDNSATSGQFIWRNTNSFTEQMRLTSTGLGIGTSSPGAKLDVNGSTRATGLTLTGSGILAGASQTTIDSLVGTASRILAWGPNTSTAGALYLGTISSDASVGSTSAVVLNGSGNLGLGVTPSAWNGNRKAFQLSLGGSISAAANYYTELRSNSYLDTSAVERYISTNAASYYYLGGGTHAWFNAPSGTAGNAITFTQAMTLDASGNLGIGTTSPTTRLQVTTGATGVQGLFSHTSGTPTIAIGATSTTYNTQIGYNVTSEYGYIQAVAAAGVYDDIAINPLGGNLGIGTSSPSASAILDAQSTTKGVRMPNMTTTQKNAISSPAAGLMVFDTTLAKLCVYSGSAWQTITSI